MVDVGRMCKYLHVAGMHLIGSDGKLHGPVPAALVAATRNSYSWFVVKLITLKYKKNELQESPNFYLEETL